MSDIDLTYTANKALIRYITVAQNYFECHFATPSINFRLTGKTAGKAYLQHWEIRLNPILFRENPQVFIEEVLPHELAHLITFQLFGRVKPHGPEWKSVMQHVFSLAAKTTHSLDITSVQGRTYQYHCHCDDHLLSVRRHNKVQQGKATYLCRNCKQHLTLSPSEVH